MTKEHVCGLQGFGRGIGSENDVCPACEQPSSNPCVHSIHVRGCPSCDAHVIETQQAEIERLRALNLALIHANKSLADMAAEMQRPADQLT